MIIIVSSFAFSKCNDAVHNTKTGTDKSIDVQPGRLRRGKTFSNDKHNIEPRRKMQTESAKPFYSSSAVPTKTPSKSPILPPSLSPSSSRSRSPTTSPSKSPYWKRTNKLTAIEGVTRDLFGENVAISGNIAIVSAKFDDDKGRNSGSAYVYERDDSSGNWTGVAKLIASDGNSGDYFGLRDKNRAV